MREIKCRAWEKDSEEMLDWKAIDSLDKDGIVPFLTMLSMPESYVVMQYTGLKDKHGVEVHEGDFVKVRMNNYGNLVYEEFKVTYNPDKARFELFSLSDGESWGFTSKNDIEVIGNVHEHPYILGASATGTTE